METNLPPAPLTLEGASVLHQMFRLKWPAWRALPAADRGKLLGDASAAADRMEGAGTAIFSMLGHKGDLMLVHFRADFDALADAERCISRLELSDFLEQTTSYVSVVELGLYDSTVKLYASLAERGIAPHSNEWNAAVEETLARQRNAMRPRLYPEMPAHKYICFYPMDRRRGEQKNWYQLPMAERQRQMQEHGEVGRRYAGTVKQIITGSIGFDDWEWGVDLFADDPLVFKRLIYEMRFDEVSAVYALFGPFYIGRRIKPAELESILAI
ncbi:MAG TPA: hydrogen peroxide-dependent heme synthase [Bryobacteraceae bacterium]|jgi:peroxiredoxin|nr:hydrogen peroxide-dependent heme synthase [Bryobacteraceae bacterium]